MMFIDLEHELDHIKQILTRFLAQGLPFFTLVLEETSRGWRPNPQYPGVLNQWQNTITEYHVRLLEFKRLYEREADLPILEHHAQQLVIWSQRYWSKGRGLGQSESKQAWEERFFPELQDLREEVNDLFLQTGIVFDENRVRTNPYAVR